MNRVLSAASEKKDYSAEKSVMDELATLPNNDQLFELLAIVSMTSSVELIPVAKQPLQLIES